MGCHAANTRGNQAGVENGNKYGRRKPCGPGKSLCPAAIQNRLKEYQETNNTLEQQLVVMESDVKTILTEIQAVQDEREHLRQHQHVILCATPVSPPPPVPCSPCIPCPPCPALVCCSQDLRRTREKHHQLLHEFQGRLVETGILQIDTDKLKQNLKDAEEAKKAAEDKVKELLQSLNNYKSQFGVDGLEKVSEFEQELELAKLRLRIAEEQLEDMQELAADQQKQINDYKDKCQLSQEIAEEQKTQIEVLEQDADKINDQVSAEIERLKAEFEEKLAEFKPLADELRDAQLAIQDSEKAYVLALKNNENLTREVQSLADQIAAATDELERMKANSIMGEGDREALLRDIEELKKQVEEIEAEGVQLREDLERMTEAAEEADKTAQEKLQEIAQLTTELKDVREESARQVTRSKELCDVARRSLRQRIADLEQQLAQSRTQACRAQRDRDEIRARMQTQIDNLRENSVAAQMRIENLQVQIKYLEKSHKNMYPEQGDAKKCEVDPCFCGVQLQ